MYVDMGITPLHSRAEKIAVIWIVIDEEDKWESVCHDKTF